MLGSADELPNLIFIPFLRFLAAEKDQKSAATSLFTHSRDAAFTGTHPKRR
jgi:hypothetical protein